MDIEDNTGYSLRSEQKEILDGLVRRFFVDGERCLLVEAPTGLLWSLLGSFGGVGVGAGFWWSSLGGF
jgi:hypothetical protein